jgi:hypothetical protein
MTDTFGFIECALFSSSNPERCRAYYGKHRTEDTEGLRGRVGVRACRRVGARIFLWNAPRDPRNGVTPYLGPGFKPTVVANFR